MAHPLTAAREASGLSQAQLARAIHKSRPTISRIESGKNRPSFDTAKQIIAALRMKGVELSLDAFAGEDA